MGARWSGSEGAEAKFTRFSPHPPSIPGDLGNLPVLYPSSMTRIHLGVPSLIYLARLCDPKHTGRCLSKAGTGAARRRRTCLPQSLIARSSGESSDNTGLQRQENGKPCRTPCLTVNTRITVHGWRPIPAGMVVNISHNGRQ